MVFTSFLFFFRVVHILVEIMLPLSPVFRCLMDLDHASDAVSLLSLLSLVYLSSCCNASETFPLFLHHSAFVQTSSRRIL